MISNEPSERAFQAHPPKATAFGGGRLLTMIISMLIGLLLALFHILGQWAGYRVLKGDDYHYPLIGKLAESWVSQKTISVVEEKPV